MFKLFGGQSEDQKIRDQKILIDLASDTLNRSLKSYYNNCVSKKRSKNLFEGHEYFYLNCHFFFRLIIFAKQIDAQ